MKRILRMIAALWPFYVLGIIVISAVWALSQKPAMMDHPPTPPAEIEKQKRVAEYMEAVDAAKQFVVAGLKTPTTAKFPSIMDFTAGKGTDGNWRVIGFVDAQNSFGAMIRTRFVCVLSKHGGKWWLVKLTTD